MVDASVGGKTGFNFDGLKNEIGVFNDAKFVILDTEFLRTLDAHNVRSGYAEMLKHGLISDNKHWVGLLNFNLAQPDLKHLRSLLAKSVGVKEDCGEGPEGEGHTQGAELRPHLRPALESYSLRAYEQNGKTPLLHGYAVAYGLICELYLSAIKTGFPTEKMHQTVRFIRDYYGNYPITCDDYDKLIDLMRHDKKNNSGVINFTLLSDVGQININQTASDDEIENASTSTARDR